MSEVEPLMNIHNPVVSHLGLLVFDIQKSLRFYTEGLDFRKLHELEVGPEFKSLYQLHDFAAEVHFLQNGNFLMEMIHLRNPPPIAWAGRPPLDTTGIAQIAIRVDDVDDAAARLEGLGGKVLASTRTHTDRPDGVDRTFLACLDPDGVRIQLMAGEMPDSTR